MSSSATGVGMPICFLGAILLILTQKSSQKFGDVLGIVIQGSVIICVIWSKLVKMRFTSITARLLKNEQFVKTLKT